MCGRYVTPDEAAIERAYNLTARQWEAWLDEALTRSAGETLAFQNFTHGGQPQTGQPAGGTAKRAAPPAAALRERLHSRLRE